LVSETCLEYKSQYIFLRLRVSSTGGRGNVLLERAREWIKYRVGPVLVDSEFSMMGPVVSKYLVPLSSSGIEIPLDGGE
jgi:hypothetical protein